MPRPERGATPSGFRDRLLALLRNRARDQGIAVQRLQQRVAFERFLARLATSDDWVLKGGFALELRYGWRHRPTAESLHATFSVRATHPLPPRLPAPPASWSHSFQRLATESPTVPVVDLGEAHQFAASFWDPVLADHVRGQRWSPEESAWRGIGIDADPD